MTRTFKRQSSSGSDRILRPHAANAAAYLDDIIIYSNDWQWHMQHLNAVLSSTRGAGLTANPEKCAIGRVEVRYLGQGMRG
ncbi:MAG: reverse transcriptase domain-containing protein [Aeromonas sp.]